MPGMPAGFASGPPPGGSISPSQLASQAAYTVLGNPTAAPASPIATTDPVVSGSSTAARFLASANNTAAKPTVLIEPDDDSGLYWDATNGVVMSVDAVDRIRAMVSGKTDIRSGQPGASVPVLQLSSSTADVQMFVLSTGASPEGAVTASPGDIVFDTSNGRLYLKASGTGNTGWREISPSESGTYTPTGTIVTNLDSVTPDLASYTRIKTGSTEIVTVFGRTTVDPTASGNVTFELSLPVASNIAATTDLEGIAVSGQSFLGSCSGSVANDRAVLVVANTLTIAYQTWFSFAYRVL